MNQAKYPSIERVERDGYLVYAKGDDIPLTDPDELVRQGHLTDDDVADLLRLGVIGAAGAATEQAPVDQPSRGRSRRGNRSAASGD